MYTGQLMTYPGREEGRASTDKFLASRSEETGSFTNWARAVL